MKPILYMFKSIMLVTILHFFFLIYLCAQSPAFTPSELFRVSGYGMGFNVEVHDINNDAKQDIIVGNVNDTYIYYGGAALLDSTVDITYTGRCLAVCDYNGDGYKDLITMHFTSYDSTRNDYNGEILFYYGSNTTPNIDTIPEYSIPLPTLYPTRDRFSFGAGKPGVEYGDFNNDGKYDIVINSLDVLPELSIGAIYIYMGNETPPDTPTFMIKGSREPSMPFEYGYYFQIGNINDDDYDDLILSFRVRTKPPNPQDSLDVFHFYLGNDNFSFYEGNQTFSYESELKNTNYSYGWVKRQFSVLDLNGSLIPDLMINHYYKDSTNHVHFGSQNVIDTIPSFYLTDPDTTREDVIVGQLAHDIGDFNNDGYNDFLLKVASYKTFSVHLGGPYLNNRNPYGLKGLLESFSLTFPTKAIGCNDQSGDGIKDFVVTALANENNIGYVIIYKGRDDIVVNSVEDERENIPSEFYLEQNYPNPFNSSTVIGYRLSVISKVKITIYDLLGKEIAVLLNEEKPAGEYKINFDAGKYNLASGIYFCELKINNSYSSRIKMTYLK